MDDTEGIHKNSFCTATFDGCRIELDITVGEYERQEQPQEREQEQVRTCNCDRCGVSDCDQDCAIISTFIFVARSIFTVRAQ